MITDRYTELTRAIPVTNTTVPHVAAICLDHWIMPFGIPTYLLTDNGSQIVGKFFATLCAFLGTKHLSTTAYHRETNLQTERYNKTIIARLRHYVAEHQKDWDHYIQSLTYSYDAQVHRSTGVTPFSLVLSMEPPGSKSTTNDTALPADSHGGMPVPHLKQQLLQRLWTMLTRPGKTMREARDR